MTKMHERKSSEAEVRQRFDNDVDRFSNIESGQTATIDAPLAMELRSGPYPWTTSGLDQIRMVRAVFSFSLACFN
jgi:tRNA (cmo5U34)-methyltransferase